MATIADFLRSLNAYPIPRRTIEVIAGGRGLVLTDTATREFLKSDSCKGAKADIYKWLSNAPNIAQGGQNYSFNEDQRRELRNAANALYAEIGEASEDNSIYGYKGERL